MHCQKIETLTIISRSNTIMPGLKVSQSLFVLVEVAFGGDPTPLAHDNILLQLSQ